MYVGAARQDVLRMSFVPEQEAHNFDRQVTTFWSYLIQRDITCPLFFLPLKLGGLGALLPPHGARGSRSFPHQWQQPSHRTQTLSLQFNTTTTSSTSTTPGHPLPQMNKPTFQLKPLGAALRLKNH